MSMLGPYASWNKETGYAVWDHPTAEYTGIFERLNVHIKGIIHVGMWDFVEYGCYTKLVGNNVIGIEANPQVYKDMAKPVADKWGFKCFNEFLSDKDKEVEIFILLVRDLVFIKDNLNGIRMYQLKSRLRLLLQ